MENNMSRRFFEKLQNQAANQVDQGKLRSLAGQLQRSDFEDEDKLRQVIRSLAAMTGKTLDAEKEDQVVEMFRNQEIRLNDVASLTKLLR
ncbi:stage VI sporulation protein F [Brevibacillus ruminantium]|uniref:Stage VI sporulation protein F n=1 Tax=Brevibacillus ruminantium TaxID=2950604 RepID=A0ABY4W8Z9_9BACL|nr:stage VI sporulation protein F [Brevibacillus ruminantium]USG63528.1 stage VI sporulation protein F [Brevibacillus ruminantium]